MRLYSTRSLALVALVVGYIAVLVEGKGAIAIKQGKVSVTSPDGLNDVSYTLKEPEPFPSPIVLSDASTFKLTFTVVDSSSDEPVLPKQAHLLFEDINGRDDVTLPVNVKSNGKASFVINSSKPPTALLPTHGSFHLTLLLSNPSSTLEPLKYPLGDLTLPPSSLKPLSRHRHDLPPRAGEPAFQAQQELFHTFREDEKSVGVAKSAVGTLIALSPWTVLLGLFAKISPSLYFRSPPTSALIFLLTLGGLEALIFTYWIGWKLYQFLPPFLVLAVVSAYTGKVALRSLRELRLKAGGTP